MNNKNLFRMAAIALMAIASTLSACSKIDYGDNDNFLVGVWDVSSSEYEKERVEGGSEIEEYFFYKEKEYHGAMTFKSDGNWQSSMNSNLGKSGKYDCNSESITLYGLISWKGKIEKISSEEIVATALLETETEKYYNLTYTYEYYETLTFKKLAK